MTGVFDAAGKEYLTPRDVAAAMQTAALIDVIVEFVDKSDQRVTTVRHQFPPDVAATITGVRILPTGSE